MTALAALGVSLLLEVAGASSEGARLDSVVATRWRDSITIELGFAQGRPERFRVVQEPDAEGRLQLRLEFQPTAVREALVAELPRWIRVEASSEDRLAVAIPLRRSVSWRSSWKGRVLHVVFADEIRNGPGWSNPWVIGGGVAAVAAGGAVFWFLGTAMPEPSGNPAPEPVPPPDFQLPK